MEPVAVCTLFVLLSAPEQLAASREGQRYECC